MRRVDGPGWKAGGGWLDSRSVAGGGGGLGQLRYRRLLFKAGPKEKEGAGSPTPREGRGYPLLLELHELNGSMVEEGGLGQFSWASQQSFWPPKHALPRGRRSRLVWLAAGLDPHPYTPIFGPASRLPPPFPSFPYDQNRSGYGGPQSSSMNLETFAKVYVKVSKPRRGFEACVEMH